MVRIRQEVPLNIIDDNDPIPGITLHPNQQKKLFENGDHFDLKYTLKIYFERSEAEARSAEAERSESTFFFY